MPELPEVETIVRTLAPLCQGATIAGVYGVDPALTRPVPPADLDRLVGRTIAHVTRRAKWIVVALTTGEYLIVHLRMTGQFLLDPPADPVRHERARILLSSGRALAYVDQRRFGRWQLMSGEEWRAQEATLGPEPLPLDDAALAAHLAAQAVGRRRAVKPFLLDPFVVAGVGNIYAMEALHAAGVAPTRPAGEVSEGEWMRIAQATRAALAEGIARGGSSVGEYRRPDGSQGAMQEHLRVYGRAGQPCRACDTPLVSASVGGRTSVWCPACQR